MNESAGRFGIRGRWVVEAVAVAGIAFNITVVAMSYADLPRVVPVHFNFWGQPDNHGDKATLFVLPIVALFTYGILTACGFAPRQFNYPTQVTPENAERMYALGRSMLVALKAEVSWLFAVVTLQVVRVATGQIESFHSGITLAFIVVVAITVTSYIIRMKRAR